MKQFYLIALTLLIFSFASATTITAVQSNAPWRNSNTWDKNRKPQNGDTVVIPAGKTVLINDQQTLSNVYIKVSGTLRLTNLFSYLSIHTNSGIIVHAGGKIEATIDLLQYIVLDGKTIFYANEIVGPQQTTALGFTSFNALPVKFVGFTATRKNDDVAVQWSTSEEVNADRYEVERSYDGNSWNTIAYVAAVGNTTNLNHYSYTDKKVAARTVYYRVKQVDFDGKFVYTTISVIRAELVKTGIDIASVQNKVLLRFPKEIKGDVMVRFVSLSGQVMDQQVVKNASGQVVLNSKVTGNYIIALSNGYDLNVARQVIL